MMPWPPLSLADKANLPIFLEKLSLVDTRRAKTKRKLAVAPQKAPRSQMLKRAMHPGQTAISRDLRLLRQVRLLRR